MTVDRKLELSTRMWASLEVIRAHIRRRSPIGVAVIHRRRRKNCACENWEKVETRIWLHRSSSIRARVCQAQVWKSFSGPLPLVRIELRRQCLPLIRSIIEKMRNLLSQPTVPGVLLKSTVPMLIDFKRARVKGKRHQFDAAARKPRRHRKGHGGDQLGVFHNGGKT